MTGGGGFISIDELFDDGNTADDVFGGIRFDGDISGGDISGGDISGGDISDGNISDGDDISDGDSGIIVFDDISGGDDISDGYISGGDDISDGDSGIIVFDDISGGDISDDDAKKTKSKIGNRRNNVGGATKISDSIPDALLSMVNSFAL